MKKFVLSLNLVLSVFTLVTATASTTLRVMHLKIYNNSSQTLTFQQAQLIPANQIYIGQRPLQKGSQLKPGHRFSLRWVARSRRNNAEGTLLFTGSQNQRISIFIRNPLQFNAQSPVVSIDTKRSLGYKIAYSRNPAAPLKMIWKGVRISFSNLATSLIAFPVAPNKSENKPH